VGYGFVWCECVGESRSITIPTHPFFVYDYVPLSSRKNDVKNSFALKGKFLRIIQKLDFFVCFLCADGLRWVDFVLGC
jgi:hypothetical protein